MRRTFIKGVSTLTVVGMAVGSIGLSATTVAATEYFPPPAAWATKSVVTGNISVRQVRNTLGAAGRSDMTVNFALPGTTYSTGSNVEAHSTASMAAFSEVFSYDPQEQAAWCSTTTFAGFTDHASKSLVRIETGNAFRSAKQGTIQANVALTGASTTAKLTDAYCLGATGERYQPLLSDNPSRRGLLGAGSGKAALDSVSPGMLTFRKSGSSWTSAGSVTRGFDDPGTNSLFGSNGTITVSWNLSASFLTNDCLAPSAKSVRGKSVKQVRKVLRSYGFKAGKLQKFKVSQYRKAKGVKRGRVIDVGYFAFNPRTKKCGTKISLYVRK